MALTTHALVSELSDWKDQRTFVTEHPQFQRQQISYLMRHRQVNGLDQFDAVRKVGRKLYIHERRFSSWLDHLGKPRPAYSLANAEQVSNHG